MDKPIAHVLNCVSSGAAISRQLRIDAFSSVLPPAADRPFLFVSHALRDRGFILVEGDLDKNQTTSAESRSRNVSVSGGLVAESNLAIDELFELFAKHGIKDRTWTIQRNHAVCDGASLRLKNGFQDLDLPSSVFDFGFFAATPRFFNSLNFDGKVVTKTTTWIEKGKAECGFYRDIPDTLSDFFPKFKGEQLHDSSFSYRLEQKPLFDLGRHAIQNSFSAADWTSFERSIRRYFEKVPRIEVASDQVRRENQFYFVEKLKNRLTQFESASVAEDCSELFAGATRRSFKHCVAELCDQLEESIARMAGRELHFSHGDLTLSNILYDRETAEICFIDPRGVSKPSELYRPEEYDLAKLAQSLSGNYEFLLNRLIPDPSWASSANSLVSALLKDRATPLPDFNLRVASLFWSLLPLHIDRPDRVLSFMLAGEKLRTEPF